VIFGLPKSILGILFLFGPSTYFNEFGEEFEEE